MSPRYEAAPAALRERGQIDPDPYAASYRPRNHAPGRRWLLCSDGHLVAWLSFLVLAGVSLSVVLHTSEVARDQLAASLTRMDTPVLSLSVDRVVHDDQGRLTSGSFSVTNGAHEAVVVPYRVQLKDSRDRLLDSLPGVTQVPPGTTQTLPITLPQNEEWDVLEVSVVNGPQIVRVRRASLETTGGGSTYAP